jgi:peptidoglycan/LPS O-acetylase OafA/YrhL
VPWYSLAIAVAEASMKRLPNIQILRACAALMIVIYHCGLESSHMADSLGRSRLFDESSFGSGVPLFFAISGFIMVVTSANAFGSASAAREFMRRRLIRIVPLYWAATTVSLAVALVVPSLLPKVAGGNFAYVAASYLFWPYTRLTGDVRPLATPGWTLNLEMLFYVIFAIALLFSCRKGLSLLFGSLGLLVAARVSGLLPGVALNFWGDPIVLGFLFGAAVGILYNRGVRLSLTWTLMFLAIGFAVLLQPWRPSGGESDLLRRLADSIPSTIVVAAFALGPQVNESRRLWLVPLLIGDASYSLYLVHPYLVWPLCLVWLKVPVLSRLPLWSFVGVGIVIALVGAVVSYQCVEHPVTRWLNGLRAQDVVDGMRQTRRRMLAAVMGKPSSPEQARMTSGQA